MMMLNCGSFMTVWLHHRSIDNPQVENCRRSGPFYFANIYVLFILLTSYNQGATRPDVACVEKIRALRALMAVALRATVSARCTVSKYHTLFLLKISVLAEVKFSIF